MSDLPDLSNNLQIETPENVLLDAEIAGFGTRCIAALIDYFILIIVLIGATYLFGTVVRARPGTSSSWTLAAYALVQFVIITFYHLFFEFLWNGQTPGKRVLGLRTTQANGMPLTTTGAVIRNLLRLFDFMPAFYAVGMIAMFATKRTQRLGDLAAGTIVVREHKNITLTNLKEDFSVLYQYVMRNTPLPSYIQVGSLSENDRRDVVNFLRRRGELRNMEQVAEILAKRLAAQMQINFVEGSLTSTAAVVFLEHVARGFELAEEAARSVSPSLP